MSRDGMVSKWVCSTTYKWDICWGYHPLILTFYKLPGTSKQIDGNGASLLGGSSHDLDTWKRTIVIVSPLSVVAGPLRNGLNGLQMGVTNYLLTGMILQVPMTDPLEWCFYRVGLMV